MKTLVQWLINQKTDEQSATRLLIQGYLMLTFLSFIILILPISQKAGNSLVDQIFFAVSIVSTTGLAPSNFASSYNFFGQALSLFFIQLGGIGYMALSSFIILKQLSSLPKLSVRLLRLEFQLPQRYPLLQFIYSVFIFTILIEAIGAGLLYIGFRDAQIEDPLWNAVFHSISAFCTAGFSLFGDSMTAFEDNALITYTIMVLSLLGSIGFIVLLDFWYKLTRRRKSITLTSKIILISTFIFWIVGALLIFFSDENLLQTGWDGLQIAIFQSISAHTTVGFNNYDIGTLGPSAIFILIILMVIGASPAGTGGGIKTTSISAIFAVLMSILKKRNSITFLNKEIPASNIYLAVAAAIFYLLLFVLGGWLILIFDGDQFLVDQLLFEVASALSTVGLSTGITADLSDWSKLLLSVLMFIGRLGVLTFGFALIRKSPIIQTKLKVEDIAV